MKFDGAKQLPPPTVTLSREHLRDDLKRFAQKVPWTS